MCSVACWGRKVINCFTQLWVLPATRPTDEASCARWHNSSMTVLGAANHCLIGSTAFSTGRNSCLALWALLKVQGWGDGRLWKRQGGVGSTTGWAKWTSKTAFWVFGLHSALDKESAVCSADSIAVTHEWTQKSLIRAESEWPRSVQS